MVTITPAQEPLLDLVATRGEHLIKNPPKTREDRMEDNWLKLSGDARKISLDARLYDPGLHDDPGSKANQAVRVIKDILDRSQGEKGTVAVFSDFFQHKTSDGKVDFNLFEDMKEKLVKQGVPASEVAIIHEVGDDKNKKELLFARVRSGKVRVIFGSTDKMGIGTNIQERLKGELHLDQPWRPDQVEQREGRIVRSGNTWKDVEIHRFIAEPRQGTVKKFDSSADVPLARILEKGEVPYEHERVLDLEDGKRMAYNAQAMGSTIGSGNAGEIEGAVKARLESGQLQQMLDEKVKGGVVEKERPRAYDLQMYQQLARKANFQEQFLTGNYSGRSMEDVGGDVKLNSQMFALGKAMATGNPDALRKMKVEHDLRTYSMLERNFQVEHSKTQREQANAEFRIPLLEQKIKKFGQDIATWKEAIKGEDEKDYPGLKVTIAGKTYQGEKGANALKPWLESDPPISSLVGVPITIGGLPTELDARESMVMAAKSGRYEKRTKFEYRLAGEDFLVPYDEEHDTTHVRSLINSFAARARGLDARLATAGYDLQQTKDKLANLGEDLKRTSPYTAKVEGMEKELAEINKRLGMTGPADKDEGAAPSESEEPETAAKTQPEKKPESLVTGESGELDVSKLGEAAGVIGNYVREVKHSTDMARDLERGFETLGTRKQSRRLAAVQAMKKADLPRIDDMAVDAHLDDPENEPLTPDQDKVLDDVVLPILKHNEEMFKELKRGGVTVPGGTIENYSHRMVKGKRGLVDRIASGWKGSTGGRSLATGAPQLKHRVMMALESPTGERKVVSIKNGQVTAWKDGEPEDIGGISHTEEGRVFEDNDGKIWTVKQATKKEIEADSNVDYFHSSLASALASSIQLGDALDNLHFLEAFKASPEFKETAWKGSGDPPEGWKPTTMLQFQGYFFDPRTAEVLNKFDSRMQSQGPNVMEEVGKFLRISMLLNPIRHPLNVAASWAFEKGVTGFLPHNWGVLWRTSNRAMKAVLSQNQDLLDALDAGGALQSHRDATKEINDLFMHQVAEALEKKEPWAMKIAEGLGIEHGNLLNLLHKPSSKIAWITSDGMMLQAAYEYQAKHPGTELKDALKEVGRIIPEYRVPTRIFDSTKLAKVMGEKWATIFGGYRYGLLKAFAEVGKSALGAQKPAPGRTKAQEVGKGWDRIAMLGLGFLVMKYGLDELAKKLTKDEHATFWRVGPFGLMQAAVDVAEHKQSVSQALTRVATPAPLLKSGAELAFNREFFSGHQIYDPHADWWTEGKQLRKYLEDQVGQVGQLERAETTQQKRRFWQSQAGVTFTKTRAEKVAGDIAASKVGTEAEDPADHENRVQRREILDQLRQHNLKPLHDAQAKHELTHKQVLNLERRAKLDPLEDTVYNFTIAETKKVLEAAHADKDAHEIKLLEKIIAQKKLRARYSWQTPIAP
jgi:hypothetical protein